ncbi:MAG: hypothetical protein L0322_05100 [Chloroflexi bacterium]|nr:hypothetical protein [Chloroflexota bacterium]MCI0579619.1 hypothetical protein [Chloroflexota bacterium]
MYPEPQLYVATPGAAPDEWQIEPVVTGIVGGPFMVAAPDASKLAMIRSDDTNVDGYINPEFGDVSNIYVYALADGSFNRLTNNQFNPLTVSWLPDSYTLTYPQANNLLLVRLDSSSGPQSTKGFPDRITRISWSPDGRFLAVNRFPGNLDLLDATNDEVKPVLAETDFDLSMVWSPDSQWLAFTIKTNRGLFLVKSETLEVLELVNDAEYSYPAWSPTQPHLAFTHGSTLYLWDANTLEVQELVSADYISAPAWSPDGSTIAVGFTADERKGMFIGDPSTGEKQELTIAMTPYPIYWSPDGQWLLYSSQLDEQSGLYLVSRQGGTPYLFLETTGTRPPQYVFWLPE